MLFTLYVGYAFYCFLAYGSLLSTPLIVDNLPQTNAVFFFKLIYCVNLIITYPLMLNISNDVIEGWLFGKRRMSNRKRYILENISRSLLAALTVIVALLADDKLGDFLSLLGAFACIPIAFTLPTLFHYRICAFSKFDKVVDISMIAISILMAIFCSAFTIYNW